jgi:hypothetical protein
VGACGTVLSCMAFNDHAAQGCWHSCHLPGIGDSRARLPGSRVRAEPGQENELSWADRWPNPSDL